MIDAGSPAARDRLAAALGVQRWVDEVASAGPYDSVAALAAEGQAAAASLTDAELDEAVGQHPRIGQQADGVAAPSRPSPGEQAGLGRNDEGVEAAIARGNEVYEGRFGRPFLIDTADRSHQEVLDELQRRLKNDEDTEAAEAKEQLGRIVAVRLEALFGERA